MVPRFEGSGAGCLLPAANGDRRCKLLELIVLKSWKRPVWFVRGDDQKSNIRGGQPTFGGASHALVTGRQVKDDDDREVISQVS